MMNLEKAKLEVKRVTFNGVGLVAVKTIDGKVFTPVNNFCDLLGVDFATQSRRIKKHSLLNKRGCHITIPTKGGNQDVFCLEVRSVAFWLSSISPSKIKPEIRENFETFLEKVESVLASVFVDEKPQAQIKIPTYSEALRLLADNLDKTEKLEIENKKQSEEIKELIPQSLLLNVFTATSELKTLRQIGYKLKPYGLGPKKIFEFLRNHKVIILSNGENYPTHAYTNLLKIETIVKRWVDKNTGEEKSKAFDILKAHTGFYKILAGLLVNDKILTINQFNMIDFNNVPKDEQIYDFVEKVG